MFEKKSPPGQERKTGWGRQKQEAHERTSTEAIQAYSENAKIVKPDHLAELKKLKQWACCSLPSKAPQQPDGRPASSTNPDTWSEYADVAGKSTRGFILSDSDPYTIIDLDAAETQEQRDTHARIVAMLDSYTERSQSGRGLHIIVRGTLPAGFKNSTWHVEGYSTARWMITTEAPTRDQPIADRQAELDALFREFGPAQPDRSEPLLQPPPADSTLTPADLRILDTARTASNGAAFSALFSGDFSAYGSQSEADAALCAHLAFYTRDRDQIARLFLSSGLGQRPKAKRADYLSRTIDGAIRLQPPIVDISALEGPAPPPEPAPEISRCHRPPGIMGDLADWITAASIRPVPEISTVAALGAVAGIAGRAYNISGAGLNIYMLVLAGTGRGKEAIATGIESIYGAFVTDPDCPGISSRMGPGMYASGQAILRHLQKHPCVVSVLSEFGITLAQITDPRAGSAHSTFKQVMLDLYSKSGHGARLRPYVYADAEKNTDDLDGPAFSIIGESQPGPFFDRITESCVHNGLVPRFVTMIYRGQRPYINPEPRGPFTGRIRDYVKALIATATATEQRNQAIQVRMTPEAAEFFQRLDVETTDKINAGSDSVDDDLLNRLHLNSLKIAALCAALECPEAPEITIEQARWAACFVQTCADDLAAEYRNGDHGPGMMAMEAAVLKLFRGYHKTTKKHRKAYDVPKRIIDKNIVPYSYLRRKILRQVNFQGVGDSGEKTLKAVLKNLVEEGRIIQVCDEKDGRLSLLYTISDDSNL